MFATTPEITTKVNTCIVDTINILECTLRSLISYGKAIDTMTNIRILQDEFRANNSSLLMTMRDLAEAVSEHILQPLIPYEWSRSLDFKFIEINDQVEAWEELCRLYYNRPSVLAAAQAGVRLCIQFQITNSKLKDMFANINKKATYLFPTFSEYILNVTLSLIKEIECLLIS
jgi:hypothetical protein